MEKAFKIYKSSAGSGKTFTLVKEYLSIALSKPNVEDYRHILAITFTNKAAKEMKERVLHYLDGLKNKRFDDRAIQTIHDKLLEELAISSEELSARADKCLSQILHNYTQFHISTIDKFLISVVRTFSNDLFLNNNFEVNLDQDWIFDQAIQELVNQAGNDPKLTHVLSEYVESKTMEDESWHIESEIKKYSKHLFSEDSLPFIQRLKNIKIEDFISYKKNLTKQIKIFEAEFQKRQLEGKQRVEEIGVDLFRNKGRGIYGMFVKKMDKIDDTYPGKTNIKYLDEEEVIDLKKNPDFTSENNEIVILAKQLCDYYENHFFEYKLNLLINKALFSLALLKEVEEIIERLKEEQNFIHISEFNKKIFEIVSKEPIPFIYERFGNKFKHLMIDEFQDTSILQWQNLIPLVEHSLSQGFKNLVVGDAKQAIYRWRGGDVNQFVALPEIINKDLLSDSYEKEQTLIRNADEIPLNNNFRSSISVIDFNNDFFEFSKKLIGEENSKIYEGHKQNKISSEEGYVEVSAITPTDSRNPDPDLIENTFPIIQDCLERGYEYRDIAILVRSKSQGVNITAFLNDREIPVVSNESFLLNERTEVNLLINTFEYLNDPSQVHYSFKVLDLLYSLNEEIQNQDIHQLHLKLTEHKDLQSLCKSLGFDIDFNLLQSLSIFEKTEYLIRVFRLDLNDAFVLQFLDIVHNYSQKNLNYLSDFLIWWHEKSEKLSISIPESLNAIQVMTIHKSKGLEFPVVIAPFCYATRGGENEIWISNDDSPIPHALIQANKVLSKTTHDNLYSEEIHKIQLDLLNILYVAFTRAGSELYISTKTFKESSKDYITEEDLIDRFLKKYSKEDNFYSTGVKSLKNKKAPSDKEQIELQIFSNDWRKNIEIAYHDPQLIDNEEQYLSQFEKSFGIQVHSVLSKIDSLSELDRVIEKCIHQGLIMPDLASDIKKEITQLFSIDGIEEFFQESISSYNEREILSKSGKSFRPDRIVVKDNLWKIIDYKTGEKQNSHLKQIQSYKSVLSEMEIEAKAYILYTKYKEIIEV